MEKIWVKIPVMIEEKVKSKHNKIWVAKLNNQMIYCAKEKPQVVAWVKKRFKGQILEDEGDD